MNGIRHRTRVAGVAGAALVAGLAMLTGPARSADAPPDCAWWVETSLSSTNVLYPDTAAAYWTMPYFSDELSEVIVEGTYLDTRYFAIQAYGGDAQLFTSPEGVESALADFDIVPDAGSTNPWDQQAASGGSWTITMTDDSAAQGSNVLPLSPQVQAPPLVPGLPADTNFLMIRVYLPTGTFDDIDAVLPTVTLVDQDGSSQTLSTCTGGDRAALKATSAGASFAKALRSRMDPPEADCGDSCPPDLEFFKVGSAATPFPNANSAYVGALYTPAEGKVVVARATMPTTSTGTSPQVWPGGKQLRYWSICNYVHTPPYPAVVAGSKNKRVVGCANDSDVSLSSGGVATIVMSFPSDYELIKKRLSRMQNAKWLPMSARYGTTQELLAFRNMLANPTFAQSATLIPTTGDPETAAEVMGKYYPEIAMCSVGTFLKSGAAGCLK